MSSKIIIARHGNTFRKGETPTRVGAKTDLPLVEEERGRSIGRYLKEKGLMPDIVYTSPLLRARQTAQLAVEELGYWGEIIELRDFTEIDYGPDENQTEEVVRLRLGHGDSEEGQRIIDAWDEEAIVPEGWIVNPQKIIESWEKFAQENEKEDQTVLLVTSNGIIRFAPYLTGDFAGFAEKNPIKVATGGVCVFEKSSSDAFWTATEWNTKPYKLYEKK